MHEHLIATDLRDTPLPIAANSMDTDEYQNVAIDGQAAEYAEPLVELNAYGLATQAFFAQQNGLNAPIYASFRAASLRVYARESVAARLLTVNDRLKTYGVELLVLDGYRPVCVQQELWTWFLTISRQLLPQSDDATQMAFALRFCSNPHQFDASNPTTWPTHATGGAVDVTLQEIGSGRFLYMGGIYLDPSEVIATRYYERNDDEMPDTSLSHREARRNRRLLYWAMTAAGFVNYPFEFWHFDYKTQAAVMNQGFPSGQCAHYGLANRGEPIS